MTIEPLEETLGVADGADEVVVGCVGLEELTIEPLEEMVRVAEEADEVVELVGPAE